MHTFGWMRLMVLAAILGACTNAPPVGLSVSPVDAGVMDLPDAGPADAGSPADGGVASHDGCAPRQYAFPTQAIAGGVVPCPGGVCIETSPAGMGPAFIAGDRGSLVVIGGRMPSMLQQSGDHWVPSCPPVEIQSVSAVDGASASDIWAGGEGGELAHYDGARWTLVPSPVTSAITRIQATAREAFASTRTDQLLHWNGVTWALSAAAGHFPWSNQAGAAWAVRSGGLLEWKAGTWSPVAGLPADFAAVDVWVAPGGEPWVLGLQPFVSYDDHGAAKVLHLVSGTFVDTGLGADTSDAPLWIRGSSDADVWVATGGYCCQSVPPASRHWDGRAWTVVDAPSSETPPHVLASGQAVFWDGSTLRSLDGAQVGPVLSAAPVSLQNAASAGNEVWLGGSSGLWHLVGNTFVRIDSNASTVIQMAARAPGDVWAQFGDSTIVHWDGAKLTTLPPAAGFGLWRVAPAGPGQVWSVGSQIVSGGIPGNWTLFRWDGAAWKSIATPTVGFPAGFAADPSGGVWLADWNGVHHFDGTTWTSHADAGRGFGSIAAGASNDVWVSSEKGVVHFDGSAWTDAGTMFFSTFGVRSANDIWAVGTPRPDGVNYGLYRWDGHSWARQPDASIPFAIAPLDNDEWWGTGYGVLHRRP